MSRIDQALARSREHGGGPQQDTADNPWELDASNEAAGADEPADASLAPIESQEQAAPAAAEIPKADARRLSPPRWRGDASGKVVGGTLPPMVTEEYRRLAALMHHTQIERGSQVLMVTSAVAGEGKTLTSTNLALTLSGSYGRQVLLIDADLRRPSLHTVFNASNVTGLSDVLNSLEPTPPTLVAVAPQLTLLTAGRPDLDPMAALTSERMKQLLAEARTGFDWVIIDTPPVGLLTDANLLAQMVDLALLVVRAESTPYELVKRASDAVGRHRIAGVVLNRVSTSEISHSDRYADYYHNYSTPRER
jgi:protein-tyrosine kinase